MQVELSEYTISSVTEGPESLAFTRCSIRPVGRMANEGFVISAQVRTVLPPAVMPCDDLFLHELLHMAIHSCVVLYSLRTHCVRRQPGLAFLWDTSY